MLNIAKGVYFYFYYFSLYIKHIFSTQAEIIFIYQTRQVAQTGVGAGMDYITSCKRSQAMS